MSPHPYGTPVFRTEDIRRIEALAAARIEPPPLMERAGLAAADLARTLATDGRRVAVLAGPGNNGGDAFVVARHLKNAWLDVDVVFAGAEEKLSHDAAAALTAWRAAGGTTGQELPALRDCGLVVDGLFGIGLTRELTGRYADLVRWINSATCPVLALDAPSGLDADTGRILGCAVRASHTVTFIGLKPGLLTLDGVDHCGKVEVASLGLDTAALATAAGRTTGAAVLASALPSRTLNSHKGTYGSVGIIGGAQGMVGAALLAGRAALKLGAGRVYVGLMADDAPAIDLLQPELMLRSAAEILELEHLSCVAVGPGLGQSSEAESLLRSAVASRFPLVLDADALNLIGRRETLRAALVARSAPSILTPHPAEAARLLSTSTSDVQHDRVAAASRLASTYGCSVVLKGAGSVCARPDGGWAINTSGNAGMATGGMGDVLTGMIAALIAQRVDPGDALEAGVYLHGAAADRLVDEGIGPVGLTAGETIDAARRLINQRHASGAT